MNRAERRQLAKCHHDWDVKQTERKDYRNCRKCGLEERRDRLVPLSRCMPRTDAVPPPRWMQDEYRMLTHG